MEGTYTGGEQVDGLVHATEGRHIDGLATGSAGRANAGGVLTGARVHDRIDKHLDGVLVCDEVDDLEGVLDDADSHKLLAVVAAVHHQRVGEALDDGAGSLPEAPDLVAAGGVRHVHLLALADRDVVTKRDVAHGHLIEGPAQREREREKGPQVSTCASQERSAPAV